MDKHVDKGEFTKQLFTKLLLIVKTSYVNTITFVMIYYNVYIQRNSHLKKSYKSKTKDRLAETKFYFWMIFLPSIEINYLTTLI